MDDPFSELEKILEQVFHLAPIRNGKYAYAEIQELKKAIEHYQPDQKKTFIDLVKAIRISLPHLDKLRIHFEPMKSAVDGLAKIHQMPAINWDKFLSHPKLSSQFQFNALHNTHSNQKLIPWLTFTFKEPFSQLDFSEQTRLLIDSIEHLGFSNKLSTHLKKDPEFLSRLIMENTDNFSKISNSRLILYLTDKQIAEAIIKHLPQLMPDQQSPLNQVDQLIEKLNGILSSGRSIATLLRNEEAKSILEHSEFFRLYQSDESKDQQVHPSWDR